MKISNKTLSKILVFAVITLMIATICGNVFAATNPSGVSIKPTEAFDSFGGKIIGGIQAIGTIVSVGILIVLGIKYMMGSAEEKAEYKKTMIPYLVGAILVFAASTIANFVYNFVSGK